MSFERFERVIEDLCQALGVVDVDGVFDRGGLEYQSFDVRTCHYDTDPDAMYLGFNFGVVQAGRSLKIFRLMLESNLSVYAQDQAQMGLDADTGTAQLVARLPLNDDISADWLIETLDHYVEHGKYWRDMLLNSPDEQFEGLCGGDYRWIRA